MKNWQKNCLYYILAGVLSCIANLSIHHFLKIAPLETTLTTLIFACCILFIFLTWAVAVENNVGISAISFFLTVLLISIKSEMGKFAYFFSCITIFIAIIAIIHSIIEKDWVNSN